MNQLRELLQGLRGELACLVVVQSTQGSAPREPGAWMAVFAHHAVGTIGGGHLEHSAMAEARRRLAGGSGEVQVRYALGPSLGQCCGGVVFLRFEVVAHGDAARLQQSLRSPAWPVALFGGGHVGHALVRTLAPLPVALTWIDSRDGVFPGSPPDDVVCEHSEPVQQAVPALAPGSHVLIMSFSHAEDLEVVAACLRRQRERGDLPFIGLIGSQTKWATFRHRLEQRGFTAQELEQVTCPIGVPGIRGKQPQVVAIAVAAQLLQRMEAGA